MLISQKSAKKATPDDLWEAIGTAALELMTRRDDLGFPLLRTRGEFGDTTVHAELALRLKSDDMDEVGIVLDVENPTFDNDMVPSVRFGSAISNRDVARITKSHQNEVSILRNHLGKAKFNLVEKTAKHLYDSCGLAGSLDKPLKDARQIAATLHVVNEQIA